MYQVYNPQSRKWVKMEAGKILDNSPDKFPDVPVRGEGKKKESQSEPALTQEKSKSGTTHASDSDAVSPADPGDQGQDDSWFW